LEDGAWREEEKSIGMLTLTGMRNGAGCSLFLQLVPLDLKTMTNDQ
jgi:hypothetical protein